MTFSLLVLRFSSSLANQSRALTLRSLLFSVGILVLMPCPLSDAMGCIEYPVRSNFMCRIASRTSCGHSLLLVTILTCATHKLHKSAFYIASGERPNVRRDTIIESSLCRKSFIVYTSLPCHLLLGSGRTALVRAALTL